VNIQKLANFKSLSRSDKMDVLGNLRVAEDKQYNQYSNTDFMSEYSDEIAINFSGNKRRIVSATPDRTKVVSELSIMDILNEYNPDSEFNVELTNFDNRSSNRTNENDMSAFNLNIAFDDFVTWL